MRKIIVIIVATLTALFSTFSTASAKTIKGSGVKKSETRKISSDYKSVKVSDAINIFVSDAVQEVTVTADDNMIEYVETSVSGGVLTVCMASGNSYNNSNVKITIPYSATVIKYTLSGATSLSANCVISPKELDLKLSGASKCALEIVTEECNMECSGASNVDLTLIANEFDVKVSGASNVKVNGKIQHVEFECSGASNMKAKFTAETLKCKASGASNITLEGRADRADISGSGSSKISASKFETKVCDIELSAASKAHINCSKELSMSASSASNITYSGDATVAKQIVNSGAKISKQQ